MSLPIEIRSEEGVQTIYIEAENVARFFDDEEYMKQRIAVENDLIREKAVNDTTHQETEEEPKRKTVFVWSVAATRMLINSYKEFEHLFRSTTTRNEMVWKQIADRLGCNATQCENRFKYLKKLYIKKKDNMGTQASGAELKKFDYFDEFEDIFGKKPNVVPIAVASSSRGCPKLNERAEKSDSDEENDCPNKKRPIEPTTANTPKRTKFQKQVQSWSDHFKEDSHKREKARERKHQELLKTQQEATMVYKEMMQKLIDKL